MLSEAQSSQFGTSPLQCYVCFRTSLLAKMAGVKRLELSFSPRAINARFEDEAKYWEITFYITLSDCEKSFKPSSPKFLRLTLLHRFLLPRKSRPQYSREAAPRRRSQQRKPSLDQPRLDPALS